MNAHAAPAALTLHLALLSCLSFGGFPSVLPDLRNFVVGANGWVTDQEFTDFFALAQAVPGPNMILLTSFIGWKVGGVAGAIFSAVATFAPACAIYFAAYQLWDRFREAPWQKIVRHGLAPLTIGLVIAGGTVMARTGDAKWPAATLTIAAAGLMIRARINPLWLLAGGGACGGLGLL